MANYQSMTDLAYNNTVTEANLDKIRENIEWLASLLAGGVALSTIANGADISGVLESADGTYTGDGTGSAGSGGQAITGLGFQPDAVLITNAASTSQYFYVASNVPSSAAGMSSFDADGFTVTDGGSDGAPNANSAVYHYLALRLD